MHHTRHSQSNVVIVDFRHCTVMHKMCTFCQMQLLRPESELDGINSGSWYRCLPFRDISLIRRQKLYGSCVRSSMLHRSETWPVRKENEVALQQAEMRMVRWMCNVKVKDRVPSKELRKRLGIDDVILILQQKRL